jgi:hypothetical protein
MSVITRLPGIGMSVWNVGKLNVGNDSHGKARRRRHHFDTCILFFLLLHGTDRYPSGFWNDDKCSDKVTAADDSKGNNRVKIMEDGVKSREKDAASS